MDLPATGRQRWRRLCRSWMMAMRSRSRTASLTRADSNCNAVPRACRCAVRPACFGGGAGWKHCVTAAGTGCVTPPGESVERWTQRTGALPGASLRTADRIPRRSYHELVLPLLLDLPGGVCVEPCGEVPVFVEDDDESDEAARESIVEKRPAVPSMAKSSRSHERK